VGKPILVNHFTAVRYDEVYVLEASLGDEGDPERWAIPIAAGSELLSVLTAVLDDAHYSGLTDDDDDS
jgi:hypothetical protein